MLFLYSLPRACVASTRRAVVSILSTLSIFGRAVWTLHPSAGRVAAFGLSSSAARKDKHDKRTARGGLLFSTRRGVCLLLHDTPRVLQCSAVKGKRCTRAKERRGGVLFRVLSVLSTFRGGAYGLHAGRRIVFHPAGRSHTGGAFVCVSVLSTFARAGVVSPARSVSSPHGGRVCTA